MEDIDKSFNYDALRARGIADERRANGLCPSCGKPRDRADRKCCDACIAKAGGRRRRWRAEGRCVDCLTPGCKTRRCETCQAFHYAASQQRAAQRPRPTPGPPKEHACSNCRKTGHNARTCPVAAPGADR